MQCRIVSCRVTIVSWIPFRGRDLYLCSTFSGILYAAVIDFAVRRLVFKLISLLIFANMVGFARSIRHGVYQDTVLAVDRAAFAGASPGKFDFYIGKISNRLKICTQLGIRVVNNMSNIPQRSECR